MSLLARAKDLALNPDHTRWITPLLLVADAALSGVIIEKIPCSFLPLPPFTHVASTFPMPTPPSYIKEKKRKKPCYYHHIKLFLFFQQAKTNFENE